VLNSWACTTNTLRTRLTRITDAPDIEVLCDIERGLNVLNGNILKVANALTRARLLEERKDEVPF
jgi:hypothetical protein